MSQAPGPGEGAALIGRGAVGGQGGSGTMGGGMLKYPSQLSQSDSDYITFSHGKYRTNRSVSGQSKGMGPQSNGGAPPSMGSSIVLYMPNSTPPVGNQQQWTETPFNGPLGAAKADAASSLIDTVKDGDLMTPGATIKKGVGDFTAMIEKITAQKGGETMFGQGLRQMGLQALGGFAGTSASGLLAMNRGEIYNPNIELLYAGTGLRNFGFSFNFIPKSSQESNTVNSIIREFKKFSSPKESNSMWEIPHVWTVKYMTGGSLNKNMNEFKVAALTNVTVQANPTQNMHMSFEDGMPVVTTLSLQFMEVDVVTRDDQEKSQSNQGF